MTAIALVLAALGVTLLVAGVTDQDPREMVAGVFGGEAGRAGQVAAKVKAKAARTATRGDAGGGGSYPERTGRTR